MLAESFWTSRRTQLLRWFAFRYGGDAAAGGIMRQGNSSLMRLIG
jgi:hypothetical protein